jgi:hypothetical protein
VELGFDPVCDGFVTDSLIGVGIGFGVEEEGGRTLETEVVAELGRVRGGGGAPSPRLAGGLLPTVVSTGRGSGEGGWEILIGDRRGAQGQRED